LTFDQLIEYHGSGPNKERQESAHAHQAMTSPDGKWLYVCDLGSDKIWRHSTAEIRSEPDGFTNVPGGSGPRHLAFHPKLPFAYLACEMTARLIVCQYDATTGQLEIVDDLATLPVDFKGQPSAAAIRVHPSGNALCFSNRQHNSVTTFSVGDDGAPKLFSCQPSGGEEPRDVNVDPTGNHLLIANQDGDNISVYKLDPQTGLPGGKIIHQFACKTPVCIEF
jgi:6-phosphogluconolactonase